MAKMNITEVRVKLMSRRNDKLRAFCSVTIDNSFVIRDRKIIEGSKGAFVAMPSRKLMDRCLKCGSKNHLKANFCGDCGTKITNNNRILQDEKGRLKLYTDIAHPISSEARHLLQKKVLDTYTQEVEKAKQPDYKPAEIYDSPEEYDDSAPTENNNNNPK